MVMVLLNALSVLIGIVTSVYSRRVLGPVPIGQVSWNAAVLAYLGLIANPGMQTVGQREIARDRSRTVSLASLILTLQVIFSFIAYALAFVVAIFHPRGAHVANLLLLQAITLIVTGLNVSWVLLAYERLVAQAIVTLAANFLQIPALVLLVHSPEDIDAFVLYTIPFGCLTTIYNFWYLRRRRLLRLSELRPTLRGAKLLLQESWPLGLASGATFIYYNCDAIILAYTDGDAAVGLYTTAYRLILVAFVITGAMWSAYFPVLSRVQNSPDQAKRVANEFATLLAWMGWPLTALGWACGRHIVTLMYGTRFVESGGYFEWLCLDIGLVFINTGIGLPLITWGFQKVLFKITVIAAVSNLTANLILLPIYGPWGAVATTILAEVVVFVLMLRARKRIGIGWNPVMPILLPPLLCSALVGVLVRALTPAEGHTWWYTLASGLVVLGGCLFLFERRIFVAAWRTFINKGDAVSGAQ